MGRLRPEGRDEGWGPSETDFKQKIFCVRSPYKNNNHNMNSSVILKIFD